MPIEFPNVDEAKFVKAVVEFHSGTPPMTFWASHVSLSSDELALDSEIDGKIQPGMKIRRSSLSKITLDFTATMDES